MTRLIKSAPEGMNYRLDEYARDVKMWTACGKDGLTIEEDYSRANGSNLYLHPSSTRGYNY